MHTSYVIINHLKDIRRERQKLEEDETLLMDRILEQQEDLKSRIGASRPDLRRRLSGRKRNHYESESYVSQSYTQTNSQSQYTRTEDYTESDATEITEKEASAGDREKKFRFRVSLLNYGFGRSLLLLFGKNGLTPYALFYVLYYLTQHRATLEMKHKF